MSKILRCRNITNFVFRGCSQDEHKIFNTIPNRQVNTTGVVQTVKISTQRSSDDQNSNSQLQKKNKIKPPSLRDVWKSDEDFSMKQKNKKRTKPGDNFTRQTNHPRHNKDNSANTTTTCNNMLDSDASKPGQGDLKFKPLSLPKHSDNSWTDTEVHGKWNKKSKCYTEDQDEDSPFEEGFMDLNKETRSHQDIQWSKQLESFKRNIEWPEKGKK